MTGIPSVSRVPSGGVVEEHRFPCPVCGSDMHFAPGTMELACGHCGHHEAIAPLRDPDATREIDFESARRGDVPVSQIEETRTASCPNCGAQVEFARGTHATRCPYCDTAVVADTGTHRHIKPRALLPFEIDESRAHEALSAWLGSLWFAPNGLKAYARKGRRMNGIYVPFWTFDAQTETDYRGQRGDTYYVTRTVMRDGKQVRVQEPRIRWRRVRGRVARFFDDVLVLGSKSLPKAHTDAIGPWDLPALLPYRPEYVAGFMAEGYQIELDDAYTEARAVMEQVIQSDVRRDIGGDQQRIEALDTRVSGVTFKHVLLPVWTAAYRYRGQSYAFVVNARSGKVQGARPYSKWKITLAVIAALIAAAILGYFGYLNQ
ncbi:MAG: DNA-directed RNA polymerase subunit RPC12/RpoP [Limimaricola cinnabarinus]|jgi:DNA-directed RNA polymerase subunit RPC12/RpoP|uniref:primosomal protein N' (replication factor Y) - superfamily II helicase n=1 Tax=Limimaricola cinnabarinus TaxID=1125964 RepID=UPI0039E40213